MLDTVRSEVRVISTGDTERRTDMATYNCILLRMWDLKWIFSEATDGLTNLIYWK